MNKLLRLILIALLLRGITYIIFYLFDSDCSINSADALAYYTHNYPSGWNWWEWSPGYYLFTYIPGFVFIQILFSVFACVLMYRMNELAGWLWTIYPVSVLSCFQTRKEALMIPLIIIILYIFRKDNLKRFVMFFITMLPFQAYGRTLIYNVSIGGNKIFNFSELWLSPLNSFYVDTSIWIGYLMIPIYIIGMFYFIRHVEVFSFEFAVIITGTIVFTIIFGNPNYREVFMPLIILWYGNKFINKETYETQTENQT